MLYADASFHKTTSPPAFYEWANYPVHLREHIIYNLQIYSLKWGFPNGSSPTLKGFWEELQEIHEALNAINKKYSIFKECKRLIKYNHRNISQVHIQ